MKLSQTDLSLRKRLLLASAITFAVCYAICCLAFMPLLQVLESDIAFENSILPSILSYVGRIVELAAMSVSYAVILFCAHRFGAGSERGAGVIFAVAAFVKYFLNLAVSWVLDGAVASGWIWDVINIFFFTALEVLLLVIVTAIGKRALRAKAEDREEVYPFRKLFDRSNCLMRGALAVALAVFVSKIAGQLINDLYYVLSAGLPKLASTWILMLATYLSYAGFGVLCYAVTVFVLMKALESGKNANS